MPEVTTVDPSTGKALASYPASDVDGVLAVLAAVHAAQPPWAVVPVQERADLLRAIASYTSTSGFLRLQYPDHHEAHPERLEKITPLEIELIPHRLSQFVPLGFVLRNHRPAFRTASIIRG